MPTRAIATSTLWQLASQVTMAALSVVTVKLIAIGLSKELAGNYNSAYSYVQLFSFLADFGLYAVSVRELSKAEKKDAVLSSLIILRLVIASLSLGAAVLIAWVIPAWNGTPLPLGITIAAFVPFFTLLAGILRTVFQVSYAMHYVFIAEVTQRVVTVGLTAAVVLTGVRGSNDVDTYYALLSIGAVGAAVLLALSAIFVSRVMTMRWDIQWQLTKKILIQALPYGIVFLCIALYRQLDLTMIALLRPDYEVQNAYYGFVGRITEMTFLVPTFLLNSILPVVTKQNARQQGTLLGKSLLLVLVLGSICSVFAFFWARPLIALLTTDQYLSTASHPGSDTALRLMSVPMLLNGLILYSFYVLLTLHVWRRLVASMLVAVVCSIALNTMLIPSLGFVGAAYTAVTVHTLLTILLLPQALHILRPAFPLKFLIRWAVFTVLLAIFAWMFLPLLNGALFTVVGIGASGVAVGSLVLLTKLHLPFVKQPLATGEALPT